MPLFLAHEVDTMRRFRSAALLLLRRSLPSQHWSLLLGLLQICRYLVACLQLLELFAMEFGRSSLFMDGMLHYEADFNRSTFELCMPNALRGSCLLWSSCVGAARLIYVICRWRRRIVKCQAKTAVSARNGPTSVPVPKLEHQQKQNGR